MLKSISKCITGDVASMMNQHTVFLSGHSVHSVSTTKKAESTTKKAEYIKKECMKLIKCFCLQADTNNTHIAYKQMSYNKIYINEYLNRDIVVYLKYDIKFECTFGIKLLN